jgi:hypothetical protein
MLKKLLVLVAVFVVVAIGFLIFVAMRPAEFHIERSIAINAPASAIFPHVNDFHKWAPWSPWEKIDPDMKREHGGAESGVGAMYSWAGDSNIGEGKMTITESKPDELIVIKLEFIKPFAGVNTVHFTFKPEGEKTNVTWRMDGTNGFAAKMLSVFMNMDAMVGNSFAEGLTALKGIAEAPAK